MPELLSAERLTYIRHVGHEVTHGGTVKTWGIACVDAVPDLLEAYEAVVEERDKLAAYQAGQDNNARDSISYWHSLTLAAEAQRDRLREALARIAVHGEMNVRVLAEEALAEEQS